MVYYFTPIINNNIASHVMQIVHLEGMTSDYLRIEFNLDKISKPTFFDVEENQTDHFKLYKDYREYRHIFILKNLSKSNYINTDFILRGMFENSTISVKTSAKLDDEFYKYISNFRLLSLFFIPLFFAISEFTGRRNSQKFLTSLIVFIIGYIIINLLNINSECALVPRGIRMTMKQPFFPENPSIYNFSNFVNYIPKFQNLGPYDKSECGTCDFMPVPSKSNSSPKDIIFTCAIGGKGNMETFIKSCRTTGCLATICIFTNRSDINMLENKFNGCGVIFIKSKYSPDKYSSLTGARFKIMTSFLNLLPSGCLNRVIYVDMYDTIFQGDPFLEEYTADDVVINDENHTIADSVWSMQFFNNNVMFGFPKFYTRYMETYCSGIIMGGFDNIKTIYNIIGIWMPNDMLKMWHPDQIFYDILMNSGILEQFGMKIKKSGVGQALTSCTIFYPEFSQEFPSKHPNVDGVPVLLHHANRLNIYFPTVQHMCGEYN